MRFCIIGIIIGHDELAWGGRRTGCWLMGVNLNSVCVCAAVGVVRGSNLDTSKTFFCSPQCPEQL